MTIIFVDTNILSRIISPTDRRDKEKLIQLYSKGRAIFTSELCDFEIRRNLILTQMDKKVSQKNKALSQKSLENLDNLRKEGFVEFLAVTYIVLQKASVIWATTQISGIPLTKPEKLDVDSIICAHCEILSEEYPGRRVIISTTNVKHFKYFIYTVQWEDIKL